MPHEDPALRKLAHDDHQLGVHALLRELNGAHDLTGCEERLAVVSDVTLLGRAVELARGGADAASSVAEVLQELDPSEAPVYVAETRRWRAITFAITRRRRSVARARHRAACRPTTALSAVQAPTVDSTALVTTNPAPGLPALSVSLDAAAAKRLLTAFLAGRCQNTLRTYKQGLEDFRTFVGATTLDEAAARLLSSGLGRANELALAYKADMLQRHLAPSTVNGRLSAIRSMTRVARILGLVPWHLEVENEGTEPYRDTRGPGSEGVQKLLDELAKRDDGKGLRDTVIVRLAYDLGLRRFEIVAIDLSDVDLAEGLLAIVEKGRREKRRVTLPDETKQVLADWIAVRGEQPGPLLTTFDRRPSSKGMRIAGNSARRIIRRLGAQAAVDARPHGLRHAGITTGLDETKDPRAVRVFSRHAKLETLMKYDDNRKDLGGEVAKVVAKTVKHRRRAPVPKHKPRP